MELCKYSFLKYEDGTTSPYKVLTLTDALDYLKDKAVAAIDIKEVGKLFDTTMIRVLKLLKQKGMLWQCVIKGKMRLADLNNKILTKAGVTLDDFIYTPIAFSTTPNLSSYINEFLNTHKIYAMELVYKQTNDPIINYLVQVKKLWSLVRAIFFLARNRRWCNCRKNTSNRHRPYHTCIRFPR